MKIETIMAMIGCVVTCGGVLIYIGRSLGTLDSIKKAFDSYTEKINHHDQEITQIKVDLATVKTRQDDCGNCP